MYTGRSFTLTDGYGGRMNTAEVGVRATNHRDDLAMPIILVKYNDVPMVGWLGAIQKKTVYRI